MPMWLVSFLSPVWQFILKYGLGQLTNYFKKVIDENKMNKDREDAFAKAKEKYMKAGTDPNLTPEQKQKEQENAFKDFINSTHDHP